MVGARRYEILGVLGKGAFGTVYKARYLGEGGFEKFVAVKVLNPPGADVKEKDVEEIARRLRDEARLLGRVRHRAIVGVDRLARLNGQWAVIMEFVEGASLEAVLRSSGVSLGVALDVVAEVAGALHVATTTPGEDGHQLGLLHRDIKPANIQVTQHGEVKLLDFGVARAEFKEREAHTQSIFFGTPYYMAPERFALQDTPSGDVYAVGCVLYEMLVGSRFGTTQPNEERHNGRLERAWYRMLEAQVPEDLARFTYSLLAFLPEHRPDAAAVAREAFRLRRMLEDDSIQNWCEREIPPILSAQGGLGADDLQGRTLEESAITSPAAPVQAALANENEVATRPGARRWPLLVVPASLFVAVLVTCGLGALAIQFLVNLLPGDPFQSDASSTTVAQLTPVPPADGLGTEQPSTTLADPEEPPADPLSAAGGAIEPLPASEDPTPVPQESTSAGASTARRTSSQKTSKPQGSSVAQPATIHAAGCVKVRSETPDVVVYLVSSSASASSTRLPASLAQGSYNILLDTPGSQRRTKAGTVELTCGSDIVISCDPIWRTCDARQS